MSRGNKSPSSDQTTPPSLPEVNAIVYTLDGASSSNPPIDSPTSLVIRDCLFVSAEVDGTKRSGRMVRVMLKEESGDDVQVEVSGTRFESLSGFSAVFYNKTETSDDSTAAKAGNGGSAEVFIKNSMFEGNVQNNSEVFIYFWFCFIFLFPFIFSF